MNFSRRLWKEPGYVREERANISLLNGSKTGKKMLAGLFVFCIVYKKFAKMLSTMV